MRVLVGNTGLIGQTLSERIDFDFVFNSKNINLFDHQISDGGDLYLSCLPATKWIVNKNLTKDIDNIYNIIQVLNKKTYKKVILFSTIDVYNDSPQGVDEDYLPNVGRLSYGNNRYIFELLVRELLKKENLQIFRLPALYSKSIKKNVLFDLLSDNNVHQINTNSAYQWYGLENLARDIQMYSEEYSTESVFNLFPEPVETKEIVKLFPEYDVPEQTKRIEYNYKTKFGGYIQSKEDSLRQIQRFVNESRSN